MRIASASANIDAPIELVWNVMVSVADYGAWNPFIVRIDTPAGRDPQVGDDLILNVKWASGRRVKSREQVTRLDAPARESDVTRAVLEYDFRGPLAAANLTRGRRTQALEQYPGEPTRYVTTEHLHGLLVALVPLKSIQNGFERHAAALKIRAESLHTSAAGH
jgi:hypothetical protein